MSTTSRSAQSDGATPWLRSSVGLVALAVLAWPASAWAKDTNPIELTWRAPEGCPSSEAVLARVRQIAGPSRSGALPLKAEATVTEDSDHQLVLKLVLRAGNLVGTRNLKGRSCADLVGAVAVALALLLSPDEPLDQHALGEPPADEPPSSDAANEVRPAETKTTTPAEPPPADTDSSATAPRGWRALLTLPIGALSVGPQRHSLLGVGLATGVSFDRFRIYAEGKLWQSRNATLADEEDAGASLKQFTVTLRGCRNVGWQRFELSPCLLVSLQHLAARGIGPHIAPKAPEATWVAAGLGLRARVVVAPWLGLFAGIDGEIQTARPRVTLQDVGSVERLSQLGTTLAVGSEWIL